MITLRPYQAEGLSAIWQYYEQGNTGNCVISWPTGTGKSIVPAMFINEVMKLWPSQRFLVITHVKELIKQNFDVMMKIWPTAPAGIYSAGLKQRDIQLPIIFGGIQSMYRVAQRFGHRDIIFIDEAHLVNDHDSSMYLEFLAVMKLINPYVKIIGMSATPFRMGMGYITEGKIFTHIVHDCTGLQKFNELLEQGYLSPLIPKRTKTELDVSNVSIQNGDYVGSSLQKAVDKNEITYAGLREVVEYGQGRQSWLLFASGIEHSEHIAEMLTTFGVQAAAVHSKQKAEYNDQSIEDFKSGRLQAIVNFGKLTTGFNHPAIDLIGMFRPTLSIPLWVQMLGRGTRPAEYKNNCIAEGSLVLTDQGLIPIEKVTINMKVWDGINFVSHTGVIYQGYKEVINYEGLWSTPEHKVWTRQGWQTARKASQERLGVAITGIGRKPIRQIKNIFSRNEINSQKNLYSNSMYNLQNYCFQILYQCYEIGSWLQSLWTPYEIWQSSTKMVTRQMQRCKRSLRQFKKYSLSRLWWSWNKVQFQGAYGNGFMGHGQFRTSEKNGFRSYRQQWSLRTWQSSVVNKITKYEKQKINKKHVFDITNAGQFNRFTVNGLLVSNCLVLDFAKNTPRLGPINDPIIPKKKGEGTGDAPVKICEECGVYNHAAARFCINCNAEFHFKIKIVKTSGTEELIKSDKPIIEVFEIERAIYAEKRARNGLPYIRTTYYTRGGMQAFNENVFPEHGGLLRQKFKMWWQQRHKIEPPATARDALKLISELRVPRKITVHVNKEYPEVVGCEY